MNKCPICKCTDGCDPVGGTMWNNDLTVKEWKRLYLFMKYVHYPFIHNLAAHAGKRVKDARLAQQVDSNSG